MNVNKKKIGLAVTIVLALIVIPIFVYMIPIKVYSERLPFVVSIYDRSKVLSARILINLSKFPTENDDTYGSFVLILDEYYRVERLIGYYGAPNRRPCLHSESINKTHILYRDHNTNLTPEVAIIILNITTCDYIRISITSHQDAQLIDNTAFHLDIVDTPIVDKILSCQYLEHVQLLSHFNNILVTVRCETHGAQILEYTQKGELVMKIQFPVGWEIYGATKEIEQ